MSPREKINFVRTSDFETVEDELMAAMASLDDTNSRIDSLLSSPETDALESQARAHGPEGPEGSGEALESSAEVSA